MLRGPYSAFCTNIVVLLLKIKGPGVHPRPFLLTANGLLLTYSAIAISFSSLFFLRPPIWIMASPLMLALSRSISRVVFTHHLHGLPALRGEARAAHCQVSTRGVGSCRRGGSFVTNSKAVFRLCVSRPVIRGKLPPRLRRPIPRRRTRQSRLKRFRTRSAREAMVDGIIDGRYERYLKGE